MSVRLNKFLANSGFASRRKVDELLKKRAVFVNGKVALEPGLRVDPAKDKILVFGKEVRKPSLKYYLLNKPKGVISSVSDEHGRKTVMNFVPQKERVYPVGRLDATSTGLILLTNDGELANKLTHPRYEVEKTYEVLVTDRVTDKHLYNLRNGINLKEGKTAPAKVRVLNYQGTKTWLEVTIHEGRNHQVKRMLAKLKLNVVSLKRVSIGGINLSNLPIGGFRELEEDEIKFLKT